MTIEKCIIALSQDDPTMLKGRLYWYELNGNVEYSIYAKLSREADAITDDGVIVFRKLDNSGGSYYEATTEH